MVPRASVKQDKRNAILDAATDVFAEQGFLGTRVADIAAAADVGKGTVYEYFASKEELLFAVHERLNNEISQYIDSTLSEGGSPLRRLEGLLAGSARILRDQVDQQGVAMEFWAGCRGTVFQERLRETIVSMYRNYRDVIAEIIREGQASGEFRDDVDAESVATFVISAHDGLGVQFFFDRDVDPDGVSAEFSRVLLEGLTR